MVSSHKENEKQLFEYKNVCNLLKIEKDQYEQHMK